MRSILFFSLAFFAVTSPVRGALTSQDLDKIRLSTHLTEPQGIIKK